MHILGWLSPPVPHGELLRSLLIISYCTCSEDAGTALDGTLAGARFDLMQQRLRVGGRDVTLIVPRDVDAVMQMYIDAGEPAARGHVPCILCLPRMPAIPPVAGGGASLVMNTRHGILGACSRTVA